MWFELNALLVWHRENIYSEARPGGFVRLLLLLRIRWGLSLSHLLSCLSSLPFLYFCAHSSTRFLMVSFPYNCAPLKKENHSQNRGCKTSVGGMCCVLQEESHSLSPTLEATPLRNGRGKATRDDSRDKSKRLKESLHIITSWVKKLN